MGCGLIWLCLLYTSTRVLHLYRVRAERRKRGITQLLRAERMCRSSKPAARADGVDRRLRRGRAVLPQRAVERFFEKQPQNMPRRARDLHAGDEQDGKLARNVGAHIVVAHGNGVQPARVRRLRQRSEVAAPVPRRGACLLYTSRCV